jgi:integrase
VRRAKVSKMTDYIEVHVIHLKAGGYSPRTINDRQRLLRHVDAALPHGLYHSCREETEAYLARDLATETRAAYFGHLAGFWSHMTDGDDPYFHLNPMTGIKRPHVPPGTPDPVTDEDLRYCLARSDARWQLVITLAAYDGLRRADICGLRREHVTAQRLRVVNGKGGQDAWLPTHPAVWALVEALPVGPLLTRRDGRTCTPNWLGVMAKYHFAVRLGRPDIHLHRFRHWTATALTEQGVPTAVVAGIMRHRSLATTQRYVQVTDGQRRLAVNTLPTLASPLQDAA